VWNTDVVRTRAAYVRAMSDVVIAGLDLEAPEQARDAVALATRLADATAAELLLVSVFTPHPGVLSTQLEHRRREMVALAGRPVETMAIAATSPARVIHEVADRRRPRAVVIGSSRSGATGLISLGAVGELLLHGNPTPVAVAPNGLARRPTRTPGIGVAYGTTPESDDAVRVAADLAKRTGARLRVLSVHEPAPHNELAERRPGERLDRALAGTPAERIDLHGEPAAALAASAADLDLLVTGSRSYGPLGAVLLGAVTRRLARTARCPLMVVPRTRDAAWDVALVGGMDATADI
jgi:nucleotide-binding universal stress UspA family protein